jgi:hypothetical protein
MSSSVSSTTPNPAAGNASTRPPGIISPVSIRNLFLKVLPARIAAGIEAESRSWILRCRTCAYERSYWDAGGIRYKASGSPRTATTCPRCRRRRMHDVFRRTS